MPDVQLQTGFGKIWYDLGAVILAAIHRCNTKHEYKRKNAFTGTKEKTFRQEKDRSLLAHCYYSFHFGVYGLFLVFLHAHQQNQHAFFFHHGYAQVDANAHTRYDPGRLQHDGG